MLLCSESKPADEKYDLKRIDGLRGTASVSKQVMIWAKSCLIALAASEEIKEEFTCDVYLYAFENVLHVL